jgi:hypothetical protein
MYCVQKFRLHDLMVAGEIQKSGLVETMEFDTKETADSEARDARKAGFMSCLYRTEHIRGRDGKVVTNRVELLEKFLPWREF